MLRNNSPAPEFTLPDHTGAGRSLSELAGGKPLLLLFHRFAGCPTTQRDLLAYDNVKGRLDLIGARVVTVTADTVEHHADLHARLRLGMPLLSDHGFSVSERYGVYRSDETGGGLPVHGEPALFVLDVEQRIAYSQVLTGPKGLAHPAEMALLALYIVHNNGRYW